MLPNVMQKEKLRQEVNLQTEMRKRVMKHSVPEFLGTAEDAEYTFYDVTFTVDGNEAELPKGAAEIRMEFKNIPILEKTMQQMHGLFL